MPPEALSQIVAGCRGPGRVRGSGRVLPRDAVAGQAGAARADSGRGAHAPRAGRRRARSVRIEAQQEIQQKVQEELGERQREMMLREQMKAIQKELGEEDEASDLEELKERDREARAERRRAHTKSIASCTVSSARIRSLPNTRSFARILDYVIELPWNKRTEDKIDLVRVREDSRRGPLRPRGCEGSRARVPGRAQAADGAGGGGCRGRAKSAARSRRRRPRRSPCATDVGR